MRVGVSGTGRAHARVGESRLYTYVVLSRYKHWIRVRARVRVRGGVRVRIRVRARVRSHLHNVYTALWRRHGRV